jgi:hypothetical protein
MLALPAPTMLSVNIPFSGFYYSLWSQSVYDELQQVVDYAKEDADYLARTLAPLAGVPAGDIPWDELREALDDCATYRRAYEHLAEAYAEEFASWLADTLGRSAVAFEWEEMVSPRYYNFETDRLFARFSLTDLQTVYDRLRADAPELLDDTIRARHTSYDGFHSFYSNAADEWHEKPLDEWDHNELGTLVRAWGRYQGVTSYDELLYDYRCGGLYEEVHRAVDKAVDWPAFKARVAEIAEELLADAAQSDPHFVRPYRCPDTPDLFATLH